MIWKVVVYWSAKRENPQIKMNMTTKRTFKLAMIVAIFTGAGLINAEAQLNENKVKRDATGIYKGSTKNVTRTRLVPGDSNEVSRLEGANGKVRFPVKSPKPTTKVVDNELDGSGRGKFSGKEKRSAVKRGGNLISYLANGTFDIFGDGHNVYRGSVKGQIKDRGSKWVSDTAQDALRKDNDGFTSRFRSKALGKH
jgi:hypothetical protein